MNKSSISKKSTIKITANKKAFTLVELAILVVVIGFVVGGVVAGRDVLNNFKLNSIFTDFKKYEAAIFNFKSTYNYLPGDFPNASKVWPDLAVTKYGAQTTCTADSCFADNGKYGINGDGNQIIDWAGESTYMWTQLYRAGLIDQKIISPFYTFADGQYASGYGYASIRWVPGVTNVTNTGYDHSLYTPDHNFAWNLMSLKDLGGFSGHTLRFYKASNPGTFATTFEVNDLSSTTARAFTPEDFYRAWKGTVIITERSGQNFWDAYHGRDAILSSNDAYILDERFDDGNPFSGLLMSNTQGIYAKYNVDPSDRCVEHASGGGYNSGTSGAGLKYNSGNSNYYNEMYDTDFWDNTIPDVVYSRGENITCEVQYKFTND